MRLKDRDYGASGYYFITICTHNRENYFGNIEWSGHVGNVGTQNFASPQECSAACVKLTPIGKIAHQYWMEIPNHFPFIILDEFVIMPNHVHGILRINKPDYRSHKQNIFGPQSENLASVIRAYKAATKKYATVNHLEFGWQSRYHERIVRSNELSIFQNYIKNNPIKWMRSHELKCNQYETIARKNERVIFYHFATASHYE